MSQNVRSLYRIAKVELVYKTHGDLTSRPRITDSSMAYDVLMGEWDMNKIELIEDFMILLVNRAHYCLGVSQISSGGRTGTVADAAIIFATALTANACNIVLAHNHPSGNLQPSAADIYVTQELVKAGKTLGIHVLDHLIVTPKSYYSFGDEGLMP